MTLRINSTAPDFKAETTQGPIEFHDWIGDGWAILFSHPKDFTPVCTTELGYMAGLKPEFDKRNTKIVGLSVDPVTNHAKWAKDIEETQGHAVTYPMIGDPELKVATAYDMLPEGAGTTSEGRTAADNATVRSVFIIGPDKKIKAMLTYPMSTGRNFDEVLRLLDSCQLTAKHQVATPVNWKRGEDVIIVPAVSDEAAKAKYPERLEGAQALPAHRPAAQGLTLSLTARPLGPLAERGQRRRHDRRRIEAGLLVLLRRRGLIDEPVGQDHRPDLQAMVEQARRRQILQHVAGEAADRALLDGDQHLVLARQAPDQVGVERLGEAGIGHRGGEALGGQILGRHQAFGEARAEAQDGDLGALAQDAALADLERRAAGRQLDAHALAARIAEGRRPVVDLRRPSPPCASARARRPPP